MAVDLHGNTAVHEIHYGCVAVSCAANRHVVVSEGPVGLLRSARRCNRQSALVATA